MSFMNPFTATMCPLVDSSTLPHKDFASLIFLSASARPNFFSGMRTRFSCFLLIFMASNSALLNGPYFQLVNLSPVSWRLDSMNICF